MYIAYNSCRSCVSLDLFAVLKGIEDVKAKGFNPPAVQDEARTLADKHLKVSSSLLVGTLWLHAALWRQPSSDCVEPRQVCQLCMLHIQNSNAIHAMNGIASTAKSKSMSCSTTSMRIVSVAAFVSTGV